MTAEIKWISLSDSQPETGKSVWLTKNPITRTPVWYGRLRHGVKGEPQPDEYSWRTDCCGRFCNPTHWAISSPAALREFPREAIRGVVARSRLRDEAQELNVHSIKEVVDWFECLWDGQESKGTGERRKETVTANLTDVLRKATGCISQPFLSPFQNPEVSDSPKVYLDVSGCWLYDRRALTPKKGNRIMERVDDRTADQKQTHTWLVVGTDSFMSGWGKAEGGMSYAAWACKPENRDKVYAWVESRGEMKRVRETCDPYYPSGKGHLHIYVVTAGHPALA